MAFNTAIPLAVQVPQFQAPDPIGQYAQLAQLAAIQDQGTLRRLQAQQLQQTLGEQQRLGPFLRQYQARQGGLAPLATLAPGTAPMVSPAQQPVGAITETVSRPEQASVTTVLPGATPATPPPQIGRDVADVLQPPAPRQAPAPMTLDDEIVGRQQLYRDVLAQFPLIGEGVVSKFIALDTQAFNARKQSLDYQKTALELADQLFGGATDQTSWEQSLAAAKQMRLPGIERLPQQYDPALVAYLRNRALTEKERVDLKLKQAQALTERMKVTTEAGKLGEVEWKELATGELVPVPKYLGAGGTPNAPGTVGTPLTVGGQPAISRGRGERVQAQEDQLRQQYTGLTKDYRTVADAWGAVNASAQDPSAAGDISLIFAYMKMLDPGSTVREGEQATAANAGSVPERIWGWYNRILAGERFAPSIREDFVSRAKTLYDQRTTDYTKIRTQYRELAARQGLNPDNVTLDFTSTVQRPTTYTDADLDAAVKKFTDAGTPTTREDVERYWQSLGRKRTR